DRVRKIRTFLKNKDKPDGLYPSKIDAEGIQGFNRKTSFDYDRAAFYFNLLQSHLQSNRQDMESLAMYREAIDAMIKAKMFRKSVGGYDYSAESHRSEMFSPECYLGAMLSRGAQAINHSLADH